jgi:hypothetical protein
VTGDGTTIACFWPGLPNSLIRELAEIAIGVDPEFPRPSSRILPMQQRGAPW